MPHIILINPNTSMTTTLLLVQIAGDAASPGTTISGITAAFR
jgi:Asp/Glu/hydantoin racemase